MPRPATPDARQHVELAVGKLKDAATLLHGSRDELVRALILLGRRRDSPAQRAALYPLMLLAVISSAFDTLAALSSRLGMLSTAKPEVVVREWGDVLRGIFGETR